MKNHSNKSIKYAGFTLIELMVAIAVMAMLAMLSWRGLDGMARVQSQTQAKTDGVLALQAGLAQWQTDLDAAIVIPQLPDINAINYDGKVLRLVRRFAEAPDSDAVRVVAWSQRAIDGKTQWLRWLSEPAQTRAELSAAWLQAEQWAQTPTEENTAHEVVVAAIDQWQIFYYRDNAWSNALSSANQALGTMQTELPDGIRLVLTLSPEQALVGKITRDWARPGLGGGKS